MRTTSDDTADISITSVLAYDVGTADKVRKMKSEIESRSMLTGDKESWWRGFSRSGAGVEATDVVRSGSPKSDDSPTSVDTYASHPCTSGSLVFKVPGRDPVAESDLATTGICHTVGAEHELRVASASASACHQGHSPIFARQKSPNKRQTNDEIDEIQPEAAGGVYPAKCRPNMHTEASEEILEMEIVAEDVQEREDAALALRLAQEQDWTGDAYQKHQSDQEKKDAELARHIWHSEFYRAPARMCPKPSKTCLFFVALAASIIIVAIAMMAVYIPRGAACTEVLSRRGDNLRRAGEYVRNDSTQTTGGDPCGPTSLITVPDESSGGDATDGSYSGPADNLAVRRRQRKLEENRENSRKWNLWGREGGR